MLSETKSKETVIKPGVKLDVGNESRQLERRHGKKEAGAARESLARRRTRVRRTRRVINTKNLHFSSYFTPTARALTDGHNLAERTKKYSDNTLPRQLITGDLLVRTSQKLSAFNQRQTSYYQINYRYLRKRFGNIRRTASLQPRRPWKISEKISFLSTTLLIDKFHDFSSVVHCL